MWPCSSCNVMKGSHRLCLPYNALVYCIICDMTSSRFSLTSSRFNARVFTVLYIKANEVNAHFISRRTKTVTNTVMVLNDTYKV